MNPDLLRNRGPAHKKLSWVLIEQREELKRRQVTLLLGGNSNPDLA